MSAEVVFDAALISYWTDVICKGFSCASVARGSFSDLHLFFLCSGAAGLRVADAAFLCGCPLSLFVYSCSGAAAIAIILGRGVVSFESLNVHLRGIG